MAHLLCFHFRTVTAGVREVVIVDGPPSDLDAVVEVEVDVVELDVAETYGGK